MKTENYNTIDVIAASILVYEDQGFIKSGYGHVEYDNEGNAVREVKDNKTMILEMLANPKTSNFTDEQIKNASNLVDTINGKMMLKKLTGKLNNFEGNVVKAISNTPTNFYVSIIASLPHSIAIDKKRESVNDKMAQLKHSSNFFGNKGTRYNISVNILDVKFIQTSSVYMITGIYAGKDIIKFWWRDQPDLSDIITGKTISIRGTVNKHENSKYTNAKETMLNRVKIINISN
jgi:hypothetical protein